VLVGLWLASILARATALIRWRYRLPLFLFCVAATTAEELTYLYMLKSGVRYTPLQTTLAPWFVALRFLVAMEAYAWLAACLPRFRRFAVMIGVPLILGFLLLAAWGGPVHAIELAASRGLLLVVSASLALHKIIGTEHKSALWHAACLWLLFAASGAGWLFPRQPWIGAPLMFGGQILATGLWIRKVQDPPTWEEPVATVTPTEARVAVGKAKAAANDLRSVIGS
jgi:hypothetical protein